MNYAEVAATIDIDWCPGPGAISRLGSRCLAPNRNHQRGYADIGRRCVHWTDRKVLKRGLRRFLMLAAACQLHHNRAQPKWQQIYEQSTWASRQAFTKLHKVLPRKDSNEDRARVRWLLHQDRTVKPTRLFKKVYAWTMNRAQ